MKKTYLTKYKSIHPELTKLVLSATKKIVENDFLDSLESGDLTQECWIRFAIERYKAAEVFEELLHSLIRKARLVGDAQLLEILEWNLRDETGVNIQGELDEALAHDTWRKNFYRALGVKDSDLEIPTTNSGTKYYIQVMKQILEQGDMLVMAGALLALEGSIPEEFIRIQRGRDISFPKIFVDKPTDDEKTLVQKSKARRYIDDHIHHDADMHYPSLLGALKPYTKDPDNLKRIADGVNRIAKAKKYFYDSLV